MREYTYNHIFIYRSFFKIQHDLETHVMMLNKDPSLVTVNLWFYTTHLRYIFVLDYVKFSWPCRREINKKLENAACQRRT